MYVYTSVCKWHNQPKRYSSLYHCTCSVNGHRPPTPSLTHRLSGCTREKRITLIDRNISWLTYLDHCRAWTGVPLLPQNIPASLAISSIAWKRVPFLLRHRLCYQLVSCQETSALMHWVYILFEKRVLLFTKTTGWLLTNHVLGKMLPLFTKHRLGLSESVVF